MLNSLHTGWKRVHLCTLFSYGKINTHIRYGLVKLTKVMIIGDSKKRLNKGELTVADLAGSRDFFIIKALEEGVQVIGLTRGTDTKFHHAEKLAKGEMMIAQFTEHTSAVKIRGRAVIQSGHGELTNEDL